MCPELLHFVPELLLNIDCATPYLSHTIREVVQWIFLLSKKLCHAISLIVWLSQKHRKIKVTLWQSLLYKKYLILPLNLFFSMDGSHKINKKVFELWSAGCYLYVINYLLEKFGLVPNSYCSPKCTSMTSICLHLPTFVYFLGL